MFFTDQSERLLPDCTSDQSQDGLLTVLLEREKCRLGLKKQRQTRRGLSSGEYFNDKIKLQTASCC